jgi:hypothetical protein
LGTLSGLDPRKHVRQGHLLQSNKQQQQPQQGDMMYASPEPMAANEGGGWGSSW